MIDMPDTCRAAVYDPDGGQNLEIQEFPMRAPKPDEILVRVTLSAICGSDLHTVDGRRRPVGPIILGHETCGAVARLGKNIFQDGAGQSLKVGDRITWSVAANCGTCFYCTHHIPQKCRHLFKYGHEPIDAEPPLNGGFSEYIYLVPGTAVFRIPDLLDDKTIVFANCSLATMTAAVRIADVKAGEAVLIQGAGMVGLCAAALCTVQGARSVLVTDVSESRLNWASKFGASHTFNSKRQDRTSFRKMVNRAAGKNGFDVAIEACGQPSVIADGLESLRIGGRYVLAGLVFSGAEVNLDLHCITTRMLHLMGLHNYTPADLQAAVEFLDNFGQRFAFDRVVARSFALDRINNALFAARTRQDWLRVAIAPSDHTM